MKYLTAFFLLLSGCTRHHRHVSAIIFTLTTIPAMADTTFEASWDVVRQDSDAYDYVLLIDSVNPPVRELWRGRESITGSTMVHQFLLSSAGLPPDVTQVCGAVRAEHRPTGATNILSNVVCVPIDYAPDVITTFKLNALP